MTIQLIRKRMLLSVLLVSLTSVTDILAQLPSPTPAAPSSSPHLEGATTHIDHSSFSGPMNTAHVDLSSFSAPTDNLPQSTPAMPSIEPTIAGILPSKTSNNKSLEFLAPLPTATAADLSMEEEDFFKLSSIVETSELLFTDLPLESTGSNMIFSTSVDMSLSPAELMGEISLTQQKLTLSPTPSSSPIMNINTVPSTTPTTASSTVNLLPYGTAVGDNALLGTDGSGSINLSLPLVFYLEQVETLYISTNGYITTRRGVGSLRTIPILAPLWADFTYTNHSTVYYRTTEDATILNAFSEVLANLNARLRGYKPMLAAVVTWSNIITTTSENITFQVVLLTDGRVSFANFIYENPSAIINLSSVRYIWFGAGDRVRFIDILNEEELRAFNIFRIDGNCITTVLPGSVCGLKSLATGCQLGNKTAAVDCQCFPGIIPEDQSCSLSVPLTCPPGSLTSPCPEMLEYPICFPENFICNYYADCSSAADESASTYLCDHDFFPFGPAVGDIAGPKIDDGFLQISADTVPVIFYQQRLTEIFVSTNGILSFGFGFRSYTPMNLTTLTLAFPLIAPFWGDFTFVPTMNSGSIYYRVTNDSLTLDLMVERIEEINSDIGLYRPTLAVIVTWYNSVVFGFNDIVVTFQAILLTNGNQSFAAFIYDDVNNSIYHFPKPREIGFYSGGMFADVLRSGLVADRLYRVNFFRIDDICITTILPDEVCGISARTVECDPINLTAIACTCDHPGYRYVDTDCEDVNECLSSPCSENGVCTNNPGSFKCHCSPGYFGNGFFCVDVDECLNSSNCDHDCINSIGSYYCTCRRGYHLEDDGRSCSDNDECQESPPPCSVNAECLNTNGSFQCQCKPPYSGNGVTCTVPASIVVGGSLGGAVLIILIAVTLLLILIVHIYKRRKKALTRKLSLLHANEDGGNNEYFMNLKRISTVQSSFNLNVPNSLLINSCNLQIGKSIGQGEFGIVYKGHLKSSFVAGNSELVAVKTLKGFVQKDLVKDLLKECAKMQRFDHPNVLKLSGVCLDGGPAPYIVMPFMANGSLLSYLKEERDTLVLDSGNTMQVLDDQLCIQKRLLDMCIQVAKGMEYLASKRVIHRDLAARNCMIDSNFVIKVADFGLSESMDTSKDYFRQDKEHAVNLPIKWLAPECLSDGTFSQKSDVWAYGITCWEIFSGGKIPYPGIHPLNIVKKLEEGFRMDKPFNAACSEEMYFLMRKCWEARPYFRPAFSNIIMNISAQLESLVEYMDIFSRSNPSADGNIPISHSVMSLHNL